MLLGKKRPTVGSYGGACPYFRETPVKNSLFVDRGDWSGGSPLHHLADPGGFTQSTPPFVLGPLGSSSSQHRRTPKIVL